MFSPVFNWETYRASHFISDKLAHDLGIETKLYMKKVGRLNADRKTCYKKILKAIKVKKETIHFFLSSPVSIKKIFLYYTLYHFFCLQRKFFLSIVSFRIAAFLLPRGHILHSCFKIPINYVSNSIYNIIRQSYLAQILCQTLLIIWDEVPI